MNFIIEANPNKSHFQRVLICGLLSAKKIIIRNIPISEDALTLISCFKELGYSIDIHTNYISINSCVRTIKNEYNLNVRNSGFAARVLPLILMNEESLFTINYNKRMLERNLDSIISIFNQNKISHTIDEDKLIFKGSKRLSDKLILNDKISSQYLTGLLFLSAFKHKCLIINENTVSQGYVKLTLDVLQTFGYLFKNDKFRKFNLNKINNVDLNEVNIEGDWSGSSFLLAIGAVLGKVSISQLDYQSLQPDSVIINILKELGSIITLENNIISVEKKQLNSFKFDCQDNPDLVPVLVPLALNCQEESILYNINRLKYKESNRLNELISSYKELGAKIDLDGNDLCIKHSILKYKELDNKEDHRLAMSYAIAYKIIKIRDRLFSSKKIIEYDCVKKSYPNFYNDLEKIEIKNE